MKTDCAAVNRRPSKTLHWKQKMTNETNEDKAMNNTNKRTNRNKKKNVAQKIMPKSHATQNKFALKRRTEPKTLARFAEVSSIFVLHK